MGGGRAISPPSTYRGNMIYAGNVSNLASFRSPDAFQNQANTMAGLQACAAAMLSPTGSNGVQDSRGYRWAMGITGYTLFNTIVPPNGGGYQAAIGFGFRRHSCTSSAILRTAARAASVTEAVARRVRMKIAIFSGVKPSWRKRSGGG